MMYNYRITSFLALTGAFWVVEMAFAGVIWLGLVLVFSGDRKSPIKRESEEDRSRVKDETPEGSERQKLSSTPQATIKSEEHDGPLDTYPLVAEADDEDDEAGIAVGGSHGNVDSGIGTSMESSSTRPESVRRRGSRTLKSQGG
jgi:hypothetical protein